MRTISSVLGVTDASQHIFSPPPGRILPKQIFVTGTDTDVGKTFVCSVLRAGLNAHYWKPVQCGTDPSSDSEWIRSATGADDRLIQPEAHRLRAPLSPHLAARLENKRIDLAEFWLPLVDQESYLLVEGAGGVMVPLNETHTMLDLICRLRLPVLVVARGSLGTINHSLLTLRALKDRGADVFGVVMNGELNNDNREAIEHFSGIPVVAQIPRMQLINEHTLLSTFEQHFAYMVGRKMSVNHIVGTDK